MRGDDPARMRDRGGVRRESLIGRRDPPRIDQGLAVEAEGLASLGRSALRGFREPQEVFAPLDR